MVDRVYFWTTIRKNRSRYSASRGIREEEPADILRKCVILEKDPAKAVSQLLLVSGIRSFSQRLSTKDEKEHFQRHLRKYVNMYMPDCPFEVTTTNRYTIDTQEASVTARREIKKGEEIKYLTGIQVALTEKEEDDLDDSRLDFSIVVSSRKKTRSLFLGPARFANHDCDANAKLSTKGPHGMQIVSVKNIEIGDEITVSYGDNYFGEDNQECLCATCERQLANGWAPVKNEDESDEATPVPEEVPEEGAYLLRRKRKYGTEVDSSSKDSTPAAIDERKRRRVESPLASTPASPAPSVNADSAQKLKRPLKFLALKKERSMSSLRQEVPISSIEDPMTNASRAIRTQQRDGLLTMALDEADSSRQTTPRTPSTAESPKSTQSTDATSEEDDAIMTETQDPTLDTIKVAVPSILQSLPSPTTIPISSLLNADAESELSELSESYELDDTLQAVTARKRSVSQKPPLIPRTTRSISRRTDSLRNATPLPLDLDSASDASVSSSQRRPGDYTLTTALLSAKYSRWVSCRTCDADFVQADAYHTRIECPRCERHSKLYGYAWPKTDREGKWDKEERVLDHRTIHRFVEPEEERSIRKGGRRGLREALLSRRETESRERTASESVEVESPKKRGRRGRFTI
ncbi:uncharacterized protein BDZ99DRAFT_430156 [Mytilinidion resinicola]|uniref:Histone-lysine N-methyltransferase SET9 n=1 Tax=Mytilinidion resinicola TaxID=574789 RepID=A0A6A6XY76_9PEZI|nr:uncharacterized protein BDZ99DRAFT_430156 [Mytilinidion resinicola]KAF2801329.1 hypothetical protein BDZ99DRAFT_430156 [Mytilinidion resinicola]